MWDANRIKLAELNRSPGVDDAAHDFDLTPIGDYSLEESARFIDAWHHAPSDGRSVTGHLHLAFLTDVERQPGGACRTQPPGDGGRGPRHGGGGGGGDHGTKAA